MVQGAVRCSRVKFHSSESQHGGLAQYPIYHPMFLELMSPTLNTDGCTLLNNGRWCIEMFHCPRCDGPTTVLATRADVRRRRCRACGATFYTEETELTVVPGHALEIRDTRGSATCARCEERKAWEAARQRRWATENRERSREIKRRSRTREEMRDA
jgi:hypothetical protein